MNLKLWNNAAVLKLLWAIHEKKDALWIRWVNAYYIKNESVEHCPIPLNATWVVRKVLRVQKVLKSPKLNLGTLEASYGGQWCKMVSSP